MKEKISADSFIPAEQRDLWIGAHYWVIPVLHDYKFDLNALGDDGLTALGKVVADLPNGINQMPEELKKWSDHMIRLGATGMRPSGG